MKELLNKLSNYSISDAIFAEENDRQFIALKSVYKYKENNNFFLILIIINALLSYQLSSSGEDYWEEFSSFYKTFIFGEKVSVVEINKFFDEFLKKSKGNKRLLNMKKIRLQKILKIAIETNDKLEFFYNNLDKMQEFLSISLGQDKNAKTILFAIKMFHYGARIFFDKFIISPYSIGIPIDSRIQKIEKKYNLDKIDSQIFWNKISKKIKIPALHLDAILWTQIDEFI